MDAQSRRPSPLSRHVRSESAGDWKFQWNCHGPPPENPTGRGTAPCRLLRPRIPPECGGTLDARDGDEGTKRGCPNGGRDAARHSSESAPIRIEAAREGVHVPVAEFDDGRSLAPERPAQLFRKHARDGDAVPVVEGWDGRGLAICKGPVEAPGGRCGSPSGRGPQNSDRRDGAPTMAIFGVVVGGFGLFIVGMWLLTEILKQLANRQLRLVVVRHSSLTLQNEMKSTGSCADRR